MTHFRVAPAVGVRLCAAAEAGKIAARLRLDDQTPTGDGNPDHHGAFQWAISCGFYDDPRERSFFTMGFMDELARNGLVNEG